MTSSFFLERWLAGRCASLLATANSCEHPMFIAWKRMFFFPFKERMLKRYGKFKGYARQLIEKGPCYACEYRTEEDDRWGVCDHCGGTGIYKETYYLQVFALGKRCFLIPIHRESRFAPPPEPVVMTIEGRAKHAPVQYKDARRAVIILFLLFDLRTFWDRTAAEFNYFMKNKFRFYRSVLEWWACPLCGRHFGMHDLEKDNEIPF